MSVILTFAVLLIVAAVVACGIYLFAYQRIINRRLLEQKTDGKKLPSPMTFVILVLAAVLLVFGVGMAVLRLQDGNVPQIDDEYLNAAYDYTVYDSGNIQNSYAAGYSTEKNVGYSRHEETIGDIQFIYFTSNNPFDIFHPSYIIFAEYIGSDASVIAYGYAGNYLTDSGVNICGKGASGAEMQDSICITGSASLDCIFSLTIYLYNESGIISMKNDVNRADDDSADYAVTYSTLNIDVHPPQG